MQALWGWRLFGAAGRRQEPARRQLELGRLGPEPLGKLLERQGVTAGVAVSTASQTASGAGKHTLFTPDKLLLVLLVAVNLGFLGYFKYFDFLTGLVNKLAGGHRGGAKEPAAAGGYLILHISDDIVCGGCVPGTTGAERNLLNLGLYMSFFLR